ncbi:MAG: VanZ family protein [Pseudomonadota bacterium]
MSLSRFWRIVFFALLICVAYLSLTPDADAARRGNAIARILSNLIFQSPAYHDKVAHFLAYLALSGSFTLAQLQIVSKRIAVPRIINLVIIVFFGFLMEGLQGLTISRTPDALDALANTAGVLCAYPLALIFEAIVGFTKSRNFKFLKSGDPDADKSSASSTV